MSIGALEEEDDDGFNMVTNFNNLSKTLLNRKYTGFDLKTAILEDETHCSAVLATLNRGLRNVF